MFYNLVHRLHTTFIKIDICKHKIVRKSNPKKLINYMGHQKYYKTIIKVADLKKDYINNYNS